MTPQWRTRYFVIHDNAMIPLIPHDELGFYLPGWPVQLTQHQVNEEGWKLAGGAQSISSGLSNQIPAGFNSQSVSPAKTTYFSPNHKGRNDPITIVSEQQRSSPLCGAEPYPTKKEYCDFWMRTGECNFADFTKSEEGVGCIYKHEMPTDPVQLRKLGFPHGVPRWYKEKTAITTARDLNWSQRRVAQDNVGEWMSKEPPVSRVIHYSPPPNSQKCSREVLQDLIDFSDSPVSTPASRPRVSASPSSSLASYHANVLNMSPSKLLSRTMASQLRSEHEARKFNEKDAKTVSEGQLISTASTSSEPRDEQETKKIESKSIGPKSQVLPINKLPHAFEGQAHLTASLSKTLPETKAHHIEFQHDAQKDNSIASGYDIATRLISKSSVGSSNERQTKPSKSHSTCKSHPKNFAERTNTFRPRGGLASSKHAAGNRTKGADKQTKGGKRRDTQGNSTGL